MLNYSIDLVQELSDSQKEDIWKLLILADKEFVPPLSERNSTVQKKFDSIESMEMTLPVAYYENLLKQSFLLVFDKERVVGFMSYIPCYEIVLPEETTITADYISTIIVHPDYRSKGITKALYYFLVEQKSSGNIATRTWSTNYAHLNILNSLGFEKIYTIKDDRGKGTDTVYYCKKY